MPFPLILLLSLFISFAASGPARAQASARLPSQCQAIAENLPRARLVAFDAGAPRTAQAEQGTVMITFLGHSTFLIETPGGVTIATDYNGAYRPDPPPTVVTMNKAHMTHYTLVPDPAIRHVLHGWGDDGAGPASHYLEVGDVLVRNVTTDIRSYGGMEPDANSIFIFEVAGLCIGHLGHLHHELDPTHYAAIGRLDVVMVPVDGGLTMGAQSMSRVVKQLRSALILPMHRRGPPIDSFLAMFDGDFDRRFSGSASVSVALGSLPRRPLILVLDGV